MFDKDSFIRLFYTIVVSILITLFAFFLSTGDTEILIIIVKGIIAGVTIWFLGEILFSLCEKYYPTNIFPGYLVLFFLILLGTSGFGYIFGLKNIWFLIVMSMIAEIFGLGVTFFYRRKVIKSLNDQLMKRKNDL